MVRIRKQTCKFCSAGFQTASQAATTCSACKIPSIPMPCACNCGNTKLVRPAAADRDHFILGHGAKGRNHSADAKEKIAASKRGQIRSPEVVEKTAAKRRGVKQSDSVRQATSRSLKALGPHHPCKRPEVREKISKAHRGKTVSIATRRKLSLARGRSAQKPTKPELLLLNHLGTEFLYAGQNQAVRGQPISADIIHVVKKLIVQVDGCYWHGCPVCRIPGSINTASRDAALTSLAEDSGWKVIRVWEHEIKTDLAAVVSRIREAV